jgi:hypothetical protein
LNAALIEIFLKLTLGSDREELRKRDMGHELQARARYGEMMNELFLTHALAYFACALDLVRHWRSPILPMIAIERLSHLHVR